MPVFNGDPGPNNIAGGAGNDTLNGLGGNDTLDGGAGIDVLNGGDGNDRLLVRAGDTANGDANDDTLVVEESGVAALHGGAGYDVVVLDWTQDITGAVLSGVEELKTNQGRLTAAQLNSFALVSTWGVTGQVFLTQGGTANVTLAAATTGFTLNGSAQADIITFAAAQTKPLTVDAGDGNDIISAAAGNDSLDGEAGNDTLNGLGGNDTLDGGAGIDVLNGGDGNDLLLVTVGDSAFGGSGDDVMDVSGYDGPAVLNGGVGLDTLRITSVTNISATDLSGVERLNIFSRADLTAAQLNSFQRIAGYSETQDNTNVTLTQGGTATVRLSSALATFGLTGSAEADVITFLPSHKGTTFVSAGDGNDSITGAAGIDSIDGQDGDDVLTGLGGNDTLDGRTGADTLYGGDGNDTLIHHRGEGYSDLAADRLFGGNGNDIIYMHSGDFGEGGAGNDTLNTWGAASLYGGDGDDLLIGSREDDILSGGAGTDTASYTYADGDVEVNLNTVGAQNTGGGGIDILSGIENLIGSEADDLLVGNGGANILTGGGGNDTLNGGGGSDTADYTHQRISGQGVKVDLRIVGPQDTIYQGVDTLISIENLRGSGADDTLDGNSAANVIEGSGGDDLIDGHGGTDTASYAGAEAKVVVSLALTSAQNTQGAGIDTLLNMENLRGSAFNDKLTGNSAANRLEGGAGNDSLSGQDGNDTLVGDAGADTLNGGAGIDVMIGGDGNDLYIVDDTNDTAVETATTAGGIDTVQASATFTLGTGVENLTLTGVASINGTGNTLDNLIIQNAGANVLDGGAGFDTLSYAGAAAAVTVSLALLGAQNTGGGGIDTISNFEALIGSSHNDSLTGDAGGNLLIGGLGNDTLSGQDGTDTLRGGAGADLLIGGLGADVFDFDLVSESAPGAVDIIVSFDGPGAALGDLIDLSGIDANVLAKGNNAFIFNSVAAGGLSLIDDGNDTLVRGNINGDAAFEFILRITDGAGITANMYTAADFVL
jgi:Ca2+-binding RTX toxin-like protein